MRALAREVQVAAARAREGDADVPEEDALDDLGTAAREELDGLRAAEAGAGPRMSFASEARESPLPK